MSRLLLVVLGGCGVATSGGRLEPAHGAAAQVASSEPVTDSPPHHPTTCGELLLESAALSSRGVGEGHPRYVALAARLDVCTKPVTPSSQDCAAVVSERVALQSRGFGPRHPETAASDAKWKLCAGVLARPSPPDDCAHLRAKLAATTAEGKGENHPQIAAIRARVARCVDDTPLAASTCEGLLGDRAALIAGGKGPLHPEVVRIDAQLALCSPRP
jgi:hypothetical protein